MATREHIIAIGVRNLQDFGYPKCNSENILTDNIYKEFFKCMLVDVPLANPDQDNVIQKLLKEIE
jgi:hypothetical protein